MASPAKEAGPSKEAGVQDQSHEGVSAEALAELRDSVAALAKEVATIAERRVKAAGNAASEAVGAGADELSGMIRRQPELSMAVAAAAGAIIALLVVPRFGRSHSSRFERWVPHVTRADLYDMADNIQRSVSRAASSAAAPVTPALERLLESLAGIDPGPSIGSAFDKLGGWLQKAQAKAKDKMG